MCKPVALPPEFKKRPLERLIREVEVRKAKKKGREFESPDPLIIMLLVMISSFFAYFWAQLPFRIRLNQASRLD